jgi:type VI secretion system protein ImpH
MAPSSGTTDTAVVRRTVEERLFEEPYSFEFVQAVRLMRLLYKNRSSVGLFQPPRTEVLHFGVVPSLSFPASEVFSLERREDSPPLMRVNFFGSVGPLGVLPIYYTELVANRVQARDYTLRDFLDIFHHRLISLFYRSWQKYRFMVGYERSEGDQFSQYLLDIIGLGTPGLQNRQKISDTSLLYYAGLIAQHPRSAAALEQIVSDYFRVPARVEQFLGAWYRLSEDAQCNLDDTEFDSQQVGFGVVVGDEIWDPQARVRLVLGPLSLTQYLDFLPSGTAHQPLRTLVRFFAGDQLDFEVQLILTRGDVPACEIGGTGETSPQLGWLSWGKTMAMDRDPGETILQL